MHERRGRRRALALAAGCLAAAVHAATATASAPHDDASAVAHLVLGATVQGDIVMAGNSNLLRAGGWGGVPAVADVDGDVTQLCLAAVSPTSIFCGDNSSSARVDLPAGAVVIAARLYVVTSLPERAVPLRVRLAGPRSAGEYVELGSDLAAPKVAERSIDDAIRTASWDITAIVRDSGGGDYVVADIATRPTGPWVSIASWTIVLVYGRDNEAPTDDSPDARRRFTRRVITWYDGFVNGVGEPVAMATSAPGSRPGAFGTSTHVIAHPGRRQPANLLFDGRPLGNGAQRGNAPPPEGVVIGTDASCNTLVDILDDSVCRLGTPVADKSPGPTSYTAVADGLTPTSGSGVDMDVVRIPDAYLHTSSDASVLTLTSAGPTPIVPIVLATAIDQLDGGAAS